MTSMPELQTDSNDSTVAHADTGLVMIYATFPSLETATAAGRDLVGRRLAACVNLIAHMRAIYAWEGRIHEDDEVVAIIKTQAALAGPVMAAVRERHAYANPALVVLDIAGGAETYLDWVRAQGRDPGPAP